MEEDGVGLGQTSTGLPLRCPCSVQNQKLLVSSFNLREVLKISHICDVSLKLLTLLTEFNPNHDLLPDFS